MKLSARELRRMQDIDAQCEMLANQKMSNHYQDLIDGKKEQELVPITDFGFYKSFIPLPKQNDKLLVGLLNTVHPEGKNFLEVTPMDMVESAAIAYKKDTGIDVLEEAFNSYQDCRSNPNLISFEKMTTEECRETFSN